MAKYDDYINEIELEDLVLGKLANENDFSKNVILIRLYDEYQKNKIKLESDITLLSLKNSYTNIINKINILSLDDGFYNEYTLKCIKDNLLKLKMYFESFELNNTKKVKECINVITTLECLLKLPVSFPSSLYDCLKKELKKGSEDTHARKGR